MRNISMLMAGGAIVFSLACALGGAEKDADDDDVEDPDGEVTGGGGAPSILSFSSSGSAITDGETMTFTAVVTDPDGIDDLIGGTLETPDGVSYGAFATAADEGSYSLTVSWETMGQASPIDFDEGGEETRTFVARFYDAGGDVDTAETTLRLHCDGDAACDGSCTDLGSDVDNCGACGTDGCEYCVDGTCVAWVCAEVTSRVTTCDDVCGAGGCFEGRDVGISTSAFWYGDASACDGESAYYLDDCAWEVYDISGSLYCLCGI